MHTHTPHATQGLISKYFHVSEPYTTFAFKLRELLDSMEIKASKAQSEGNEGGSLTPGSLNGPCVLGGDVFSGRRLLLHRVEVLCSLKLSPLVCDKVEKNQKIEVWDLEVWGDWMCVLFCFWIAMDGIAPTVYCRGSVRESNI